MSKYLTFGWQLGHSVEVCFFVCLFVRLFVCLFLVCFKMFWHAQLVISFIKSNQNRHRPNIIINL